MRKILFTLLLIATSVSAFAQFEQGKKYASASLTGFDMSYSKRTEFALGLNLQAGYFIQQDWMVLGEFGMDYSHSDFNSIYVGAKGRYYMEENGLYLGFGAKYVHEFKSMNDVELTPEVGYSFFLNRYVTIEPSVYYDMSLTDFANKSKVGVKIGLGFYF